LFTEVLIATVLAHHGKFQEAAKLYCKANRVERAIDMFSDLRKWEEARQFGDRRLGHQFWF